MWLIGIPFIPTFRLLILPSLTPLVEVLQESLGIK
jgi:hypothetical protein